MVSESKRERMHWLDIAKGLAIIFVIIGHVVSSYHRAGQFEDAAFFNFMKAFAYSFHMDLFIFISGFFYAKAYNANLSKKKQYIKKILAYGVPYIFFSVLWWLSKILFSQFVNSELGIKDILLIPLYPITFMWYIYALLIMHLIQILLDTSKKNTHLLIAFVIFLVIPLVKYDLFQSSILSDIAKHYFYFVLGVYYGDYLINLLISAIKKYKYLLWIEGGVMLIGNSLLFIFPQLENQLTKIVLAGVGIAFILSVSYCIQNNKILEYLGVQSMPIYLLHGYFIAMTRVMINRFGLPLFDGIFPLVVCTFLSLIFSLVIYAGSKRFIYLDFFFYPLKYTKRLTG